jgi:hypothetical protein
MPHSKQLLCGSLCSVVLLGFLAGSDAHQTAGSWVYPPACCQGSDVAGDCEAISSAAGVAVVFEFNGAQLDGSFWDTDHSNGARSGSLFRCRPRTDNTGVYAICLRGWSWFSAQLGDQL